MRKTASPQAGLPDDLRGRHAQLSAKILEHRRLYYQEDNPSITDADYDKLELELKQLERDNPDLAKASVLRGIGAPAARGFAKHKHLLPMGSLENAFDAADIDAYIAGLKRFLSTDVMPSLSVEPKIDGLAMSLTYKDGKLALAVTRGDGKVGEIHTDNVRTIASVPDKLSGAGYPALLEVWGEVYMTRPDMLKLNLELEKLGEKTFANARNAASGSIRQINPSMSALRPLRFLVHGVGFHDSQSTSKTSKSKAKKYSELRKQLASWGLPLCPLLGVANSKEELLEIFEGLIAGEDALAEAGSGFDFEMDGLAYKVDDFALQQRLGYAGRYPRWAIAHKFPVSEVVTTLRGISLQVGRTGQITPIADLEPVVIDGAEVARASLHNSSVINARDIRVGDTVMVKRAGGVIPQVTRPVEKSRASNSKAFQFPDACPDCGTKLVKSEDGKDIRCPAGLACQSQRFEWLCYVVSRPCLDITGLGRKSLQQFVDLGWLAFPADIFRLKNHGEEILQLEGWSDLSCRNLLAAIEEARKVSFDLFIMILGIPNAGLIVSGKLARHFTDYRTLRDKACSSTRDDFATELSDATDGLGLIMGQEIHAFFANKQRLAAADDLHDEMQVTQYQEPASFDGALSNCTVCFTGTISISRQEAKLMAQRAGAKVVSQVSASLDYLVVGEKPGSKASKAKELEVTIIDENQFGKLVAKD